MTSLPQASAEALATSEALSQHIAAEIAAADGWIPFSRYMELALYAPGLGYYAAGSAKLGAAGDFTTAPEMSALFGATLAQQIAELLPQTAGVIYEFGAGTGKLAADILQKLEQLGTLPARYVIIDLSADLIERQQTLLRERLPHLLDKVTWLSTLPDTLDGIVIGNEVLDAMPCELLLHNGQSVSQRGVSLKDGRFVLTERPLQDTALAELAQSLIPAIAGYSSEISLANRAFIHTLGERLTRGALLFIDYGFPAHEYYHPQRHMGTLIGHYRHHTVTDPFYLPGLMDLTCHVDFTAIAETGLAAGLDLIGYTSQAQFLLSAGITDELALLDPEDVRHYVPQSSAVQKLCSPAEMGELFKVIGFGRGISIDWRGLIHGDRCHTL